MRVTGRGRYRRTVKRTRTLKRLAPGSYRVATPSVSTPAGAATGRPSKRRVRVRAGRTVRVTAKYVWTDKAPAPSPPDTTPPGTSPPDTSLPDTTPPGKVTGLTAGQRTPDSIALSWTNPADPDLDTVIVRRAKGATAPATPVDGTDVLLGSATASAVTDTGLEADSVYSYAVFTRDTSGNTSGPATLTTSTTRPPEVYPVFNYPESGQRDPAIRTELVRLLDQVPSGAQIEASFFIITPTYPVVDALIDAHDRGAAVRVVLDSGYRQSAATDQAMDETFARLTAVLGGDTSAASFAMQCDRACISKEDDSIQHNKFVLMSASGDLNDVVFQTTSNMRAAGSGDAEWNAAVVSSGNAEVYASYRGYFEDLAAQRTVDGNDYNAARPPATYGKFTPYYFPRTDGVDTVAQTLSTVDCDASTTVDVMATHFVRTQVRDSLNAMSQAGCGVRVISRPDNITPELCQSLVDADVEVQIGDEPSASKVGIHGKYLTISGGATNQHLVWMGSHNLTDNALLRNDETFLMIDDQSLHDAFQENFQTIWEDPSMTPGCSTVP